MGTLDFTDYIYDAQQGSQSAIKFIYDNTLPSFYKEALAFMRNRDDAECAVRDAYIFVLDHLSSLEDTSKFLLWSNEVCKNTCISRLKQAGVFNDPIPPEAFQLVEVLPASEYDPLINMNANMTPDHIQMCLEAVLNSLPDNQRACVILWGEGYPLKSIARKLGASETYVNYTLACALDNISDSITTLGENGLPLFSMEPIPYFLWLLISYYQYYQPEVLVPGSECSFFNIMRVLTPNEGSVYATEYESVLAEEEDTNGKIKHITAVAEETELDVENFINGEKPEETTAASTETEKTEEAEKIPAPPMDVYTPHEGDPDLSEAESYSFNQEESKAQETAETSAPAEEAPEAKDETPEAKPAPAKKKTKTGLWITLIIILALIMLFAVAMIFYGKQIRSMINDLFHPVAQPQTEAVTEPVTDPAPVPAETTAEPETTTEAETEPEATTEEETTTAEEVLGPEYTAVIYAFDDFTGDPVSLAMKAEPNGDADRVLYILPDDEFTIRETQDGWGLTTYYNYDTETDDDGWVWLEYTRVVGNCQVTEPEEMLEEPEQHTVNGYGAKVELRTGPGTSYSTFGPIPDDTEITVEAYLTDDFGTWAYTSYDGHYGWISSNYF